MPPVANMRRGNWFCWLKMAARAKVPAEDSAAITVRRMVASRWGKPQYDDERQKCDCMQGPGVRDIKSVDMMQ